ncbi:MAG TPA: hypothetical protein VMU37_01655 [Caulobacteraceae bacterium]|nr:hypothetical protein [Caulobacteraceae bacterium]
MLLTLHKAKLHRATALFLCAAFVALSGCAPRSVGGGGQTSQLDNQIGAAIGDPSTCVLLAERKTGRVIYRYGDEANCDRQLPACDRPGTLNAKTAFQFAAVGRMASCPSSPDGSRMVGWAEGSVQSQKKADLVYSAVMEGQRALPGHEINARLFDAFAAAGV